MEILKILEVLLKNEDTTSRVINMVPSENFSSVLSRIPMILDVYNRYFFNTSAHPDFWNFRGAQDVFQIETEVAMPILKELSKARFINLRPISGLNGMALVLKGLGGGKDSNILTVSPAQGGHYATKDLAQSFGMNVDFICGVDEYTIDYDGLGNQLKNKVYNLIYIDQSHCLFPIDVEKLVGVVRSVSPETTIHVDVSHWLGLIFGGAMRNPLEAGADSFGGSTHKTFPGPQRAVYCTNNEALSNKIRDAQFYMISSHHFGAVVSLAIALLEFKQKGGPEYAHQVVKNSKVLAQLLHQYGYDVKGREWGFTAGHQIWMSTGSTGIDSYEASERLFKCGIRVNVLNDIPGTNELTLRIGVNEITRFGAKEDDMKELAFIMNSAIKQEYPFSVLNERVEKLRTKNKNFYGFNLKSKDLYEKVMQLFNTAIERN